MLKRSNRIENIGLSEIVQISESAAAMRVQGHDVLALSTGEPDFPTPDFICQAATQAMNRGQTRYTATAGTLELRNAIANQAGFSVEPNQVIVSTGAKQVLSNAFQATLNEGDEVIIPTPYWTSYSDIVSVAGGRCIFVPCVESDGFKLSPEKLAATITPKTRWLILNTPSNPTGSLYSKEELNNLARVLANHPDVWVLSDEIYQHISYIPFTSFRIGAPELADQTLIVNGVSKAHSMTGWRIGWGIGPVDLIQAMVCVQGQSTSGACSISQAAAVTALETNSRHLQTRRSIFQSRRDAVVSTINDIPGLSCLVPDGAFYAFVSCQGIVGAKTPNGDTLLSDADFCKYVLEVGRVALVPGRAFGAPNHFRLSYAYSDETLADGLQRIRQAVNHLSHD